MTIRCQPASEGLGSVGPMVWAEEEWVEDTERRRGKIAGAVVIALTLIGGALYVWGLLAAQAGVGGLVVLGAGVLVLLATALAAMALHPYRRVSSDLAPPRVFHISPAIWSTGDLVTLEASRCRKKQAIAERRWARRARLVFFFRQRPTLGHARGQTLSGRRRAPRYLYELELQYPIDPLYARGAALATTSDVTVVVISRQDLGRTWKRTRANK